MKGKLISGKNIAIAVLILVILYLATCRHNTPAQNVNVPTVTDQKAIITHDSIMSVKQKDSVNALIEKLMIDANTALFDRDNALADNLQMQHEMDGLLTEEIPDTCKPFKDAIDALNKKQVLSNNQKDAACDRAIQRVQEINAQKNAMLGLSKQEYLKLKVNFDKSLQYQQVLMMEVADLKPKHSLGVGVTTEISYILPLKFDAGIQLYYQDRKGTRVTAGLLTNQRVQLSLTKSLFKF